MGVDGLTAGAVARRLGVAVTTLRTWHQRYGLGPSHHAPGQHRRYTPEDMFRLQLMRRLTAQGVAPAEAAAWALRVPVPTDVSDPDAAAEDPSPAGPGPAGSGPAGPGPAGSGPAVPGPAGPGPAGRGPAVDARWSSEADPTDAAQANPDAEPLSASWRPPTLDLVRADPPAPAGAQLPSPPGAGGPGAEQTPESLAEATFMRPGMPRPPGLTTIDAVWPELTGRPFVARDGGGHTLHTGRAGPAARGLARAAMRLDGPALRDILEMSVTDRGVVATWEEMIRPVLVGIGERYAATERFIEVEHLLSRGVTEVLSAVTRPPSTQVPRVLLAAADEEQHILPLEALAAALAQAGVPSRFLGGRVPSRALSDAVARTGPAAVVLWSQTSSTGDPGQWAQLLSGPHRPVLAAAAGPGWPVAELPADVTTLGSLTEAVHLVAMAALPAGRAN